MTDDKEAFEFFDRIDQDLEFDPLDFVSKESLLNRLDNEGFSVSQKQLDTLFQKGEQTKLDFVSAGIQKITINYSFGTQTRFVIPNQRGLFGIQRAVDYLRGVFR